MKTKNLLLIGILVLFLSVNKTQAQTWAPIGATWHYIKSYDFPPYLQSFTKITSIKDTVINTINCKMLIKYKPGMTGIPNVYTETLYMYESNQKIYYFVESLNRFCLLYDFAANAGDWWILDEFPASWGDTVKVISTGNIIINGHQKKTMQLINTSIMFGFGGNTIEGIGSLYYMFPTFDMSYDGPLRCYQDNTLGLYETGVSPTCETTSIGIEEYAERDNIFIYPNPAEKNINLLLENNKNDVIIKIINTKGQVLIATKTRKDNETIDISNLPAGMYMVQFVFVEKTINKKLQILK